MTTYTGKPTGMNQDDPAVLAHLNMLQGVITRLAGNSASCKTWCLTLVSALIAFAGAAHSAGPIVLTILPVVMLLLLDAAYLGNEVAYRELFNDLAKKIRGNTYQSSDLFDLKASLSLPTFGRALKSWSIYIFYYPLIAIYVVVINCPELGKILAASAK
jgi:hypothetical protein